MTDLGGSWESYRVLTASLNWRLESADRVEFSVALSGERTGKLPRGAFTQELHGAQLSLNLSPDLVVNSFVQYDNDSRSLGANTRCAGRSIPRGTCSWSTTTTSGG